MYKVEVLNEVRALDMPTLLDLDPALGRAVAELIRELYSNPWLGQEMRSRMRLEILANCRKVLFDVPGWSGKPRYRLIYRNDPQDASIAVVTVLAIGPRAELEAYRVAATRLGKQQRDRAQHEH